MILLTLWIGIAPHLQVSLEAQSGMRPAASLQEVLRISGGDSDLSAVGSLARGTDGTIWVSQPQDGNIRAFGDSGRPDRTLGRRGEGPGEFSIASRLRADGAGLWVTDDNLRRITHFGPPGTTPTSTPISRPPGIPSEATWVGAGDRTFIYQMRAPAPLRGGPRDTWTLLAAVPQGNAAIEVASLRARSCSHSRPGGNLSLVVPLCHMGKVGLSPNARYIATAEPDSVRGTTTGLTVELHGDDGRRFFRTRIALGPSPISKAVQDSIARRVREREAHRDPRLAEAMLASGKIPTTWPPVVEVAVSDLGATWLVLRSGPEGKRELCLMTRDGRLSGCAALPASVLRVGWVDDRHALMIEESADGLHDVVLYRLENPRQ